MIVYFEGVDGSGKTTIVNKLHEVYGYDIVPSLARYTDKHQELCDWYKFDEMLCDTKTPQLVDRSPLSEFVYRLVRQDGSTYLRLKDLYELMYKKKVVICQTPYAWQRAQLRGEDNIVDPELHEKIANAYIWAGTMLKQFCNTKVLFYNTSHPAIGRDLIKFIEEEVTDGI